MYPGVAPTDSQPMYQDILLATDGSDAARRATDHGIELANQLDATLHVLSVSEDGPHAEDQQDRLRNDPEEGGRRGRHGGRGVGDSRGCRRNHGHPPRRPQEQIVDFAETNPVDMIIVGTAGRSGLDHLISGSVAEEIVRNAPVPVLTVREQS